MASLRIRGKDRQISILFRYHGVQKHVASPYKCDRKGEKNCACRGCKAAYALGIEIERKIKEDNFDLKEYFPSASDPARPTNINDNILITEYMDMWLDLKILTKSTRHGYKSQVNRICPHVKGMQAKDFKPFHARGMVKAFETAKLSAKTIKNTMFMLHSMFQDMLSDEIIKANPCAGLKMPKVIKQQPDPFSINEVAAILDAFDQYKPELTAFFAIGFYCGLRTGEILALDWSDIDFVKKKISVSKTCTAYEIKQGTKTGKSIIVDIIEPLEPYINRHKTFTYMKGEAMFVTKDNERIRSYMTIVRAFKEIVKDKLKYRYRQPYQMRHTFAVMMLSAGEDPNWVKNQLGHSTLSMLFNIYGNCYVANDERRPGSRFHPAESTKNVVKLLSSGKIN